MTESIELNEAELAVVLEALEDAAFYRETRSRVLKSAVKREQRGSASTAIDPAITAGDDHRRKAQSYAALAIKLRGGR